MRLTVVGSSDAFHSGGRRHASYHLRGIGSGPWMVDFGATSLLGMRKLGLKPAELTVVVLTHLHGDHFGGLPFLVLDAMFKTGRTEPLTIVGPPNTRARVTTLFECLYPTLAHQTRAFELVYIELAPGESALVDGETVQAFAAEHMTPPEQAMCLRVTTSDIVIAFSGDTELCDGLFAAASGADLLVMDCTGYDAWVGRHCTWRDLSPSLPKFGATPLLLTHLGEEMRARLPTPPTSSVIRYAEDGLVLDVSSAKPAQ